jgi:hypothetical protein
MMWIIHGYHPYPQEFIHHPRIFTWMHPDGSMVVPSTLSLGNGMTIIFTEDNVPAPPTTTFTDNIPRLNSMWDDTSVHWNQDSVLKIFGHPIALSYWPEVYM